MELPVLSSLLDKIGVRVEVVKSAKHKDVGSPFRDMTESDRALLQDVVADVYEQFVEVVCRERGLDADSVRKVADGRILTGRQAYAFGLVDTLGTLADARQIAADRCGIRGEPRLVRARPRLRAWLREFVEDTSERLFGVSRSPRVLYRWY
jgi:protease-4